MTLGEFPRSRPLIWNERWHLAALSTADLLRIGLLSVVVGLVFTMFHYLGNTTDVGLHGRSTLRYMVFRWSDTSVSFGGAADYSHGFLIPLVSAGLVWYRRDKLREATTRVSLLGLAVVVGALALHWAGARAEEPRLSLVALIGLIWGIPFYLYGWGVARWLMFPCVYLVFAVPLNFLDAVSVRLQLIMSTWSAWALNAIGLPAERNGTQIFSLCGGFDFEVAAPCSGLRSILAITALTAVYGYLTQRRLWKQWALFLCCVPLAILGNATRILALSLFAEIYGQELNFDLAHDYSGYVVFAVVVAAMVTIGNLLNFNYKRWYVKWMRVRSAPILS